MAKSARFSCFVTTMIAVFQFLSISCRADENPLKVGIILPLSGALAEYGVAGKNGLEMARIDNPAALSGIHFIYEDSQYDPKTAISAFRKLHEIDHADLIYNWGGATSDALTSVAEAARAPLVVTGFDRSVMAQKKYVVKFYNYAEPYAAVLLKYARQNHWSRLAVVKNELSYINFIIDAMQKQLMPGESLTVTDTFDFAASDFKSSIAKLRQSKFDALGVFLVSGAVSKFYRQAAEQHFAVPTFGTDFFESASEVTEANGTMTGAVYPNTIVNDDFRRRYLQRFRNDSQITEAGRAYDFANLISTRLRAGLVTAEKIIELLTKGTSYEGVAGSYVFHDSPAEGKYFSTPVYLRRITDKGFETLTDFEAQ